MPEQKQTLGLNATYDHCDTNAVLYQLSKVSTEHMFILFADCMNWRLLRSEGFYPGRHIRVLSGHDYYGDGRRVVKDEIQGAPLREIASVFRYQSRYRIFDCRITLGL